MLIAIIIILIIIIIIIIVWLWNVPPLAEYLIYLPSCQYALLAILASPPPVYSILLSSSTQGSVRSTKPSTTKVPRRSDMRLFQKLHLASLSQQSLRLYLLLSQEGPHIPAPEHHAGDLGSPVELPDCHRSSGGSLAAPAGQLRLGQLRLGQLQARFYGGA
ncbi:unnamed protein product [Boreogadus saida]